MTHTEQTIAHAITALQALDRALQARTEEDAEDAQADAHAASQAAWQAASVNGRGTGPCHTREAERWARRAERAHEDACDACVRWQG